LIALDAIKSKSHRVSGKMVFPFNVVRIHLSGVPEKQAETFQSEFLSKYFEEELRGGLARSSYRFPDDLRVEMLTSPVMPGPKENWIRVEAETVAPPPREAATPALARPALLIVQGTANVTELRIEKVRTNIGRTIDVYKSEGPSRRNDLAFEEDTEVNRTVSREHAHLMWDKKSGEVRIFNDRWYKTGPDSEANCGIWIVRDGLSQPIHRNARGVALKAGDEIHLGTAILAFAVR
jgi:pSer/pThr/pTyr-binding forkhead associated (FHA) protein